MVVLATVADEHVPYRPVTLGPFVTVTAPIPPRGRLTLQPIAAVSFAHASLDAAGGHGPDSLRSTALTLFTEYALDDDVAFGAQMALLRNERIGASSFGLADLALFGRRVLSRETAWGLPESTLLLGVKVPTGNAETHAPLLGTDVRGSGRADLTFGIDLTRGIRPVLVHADLLLIHPLPARIGGVDVQHGDILAWAVSVEWPFWPDRLGLMVEANGKHQLTPTIAGTRLSDGHVDEIVFGIGAEILFTPDLQVLLGYQRTLWGRNVTGFDTVIVTVVPTLL